MVHAQSPEGEADLEERLAGGQHITIQHEQDADSFETPISHGPDGGVGECVRCSPVEEYQRSGWKLVKHPFLVGDAADQVQSLVSSRSPPNLFSNPGSQTEKYHNVILTFHCLCDLYICIIFNAFTLVNVIHPKYMYMYITT